MMMVTTTTTMMTIMMMMTTTTIVSDGERERRWDGDGPGDDKTSLLHRQTPRYGAIYPVQIYLDDDKDDDGDDDDDARGDHNISFTSSDSEI